MELTSLLKAVVDGDTAPVVICELDHTVVYMNPAAIKRYENRGGEKLIGQSIFGCHHSSSNKHIEETVEWFKKSAQNNRVREAYNPKENKDIYTVALRNEEGQLIGYYEKHEYRTVDNVSFYDYV